MRRTTNYLRAFFSYWPIARALSTSFLSRVKLFVVLLSIPVRKRLWGRTPKPLHFSHGSREIIFFVRDGMDISALREVFVDHEYDFSTVENYQPARIADIGAHVGSAALYLHLRFPDAQITSYEPDPENFRVLAMNLAPFKNIMCVQAAIAPTSGTTTFYANDSASTRSSLKKESGGEGRTITVTAVLFDEVVRVGADLVKFDVEGAEYDLFAAASQESKNKVSLYIGEIHPGLMQRTRKEFEDLFPGCVPTWKDSFITLRRRVPSV